MSSAEAAFKRSILICTGDNALRDELKKAFVKHGFVVSVASDSIAALHALEGTAPDAMLCDQSLPENEGMALLQAIRRERPELADMPIVVMSEYGQDADIVAGKLAGADDYFVKPVQPDLLIAAIEALLRMADRMRAAMNTQVTSSPDGGTGLRAPYVLFDQFSFGIILFDPFGHMIFTNRAAKSLSRINTSTIREWVMRQAGQAGLQNGDIRNGTSRVLDFRMIPTGVSRGSIAQHLFVATMLLTRHDDSEAVFAAVVFPSAHVANLGNRLVAEAIGLTPTESRLASLLAEGLRLDQIGEMMGIAKPTVNYHLRNIYQKCGYSRQSDLISLLRSVQLTDQTGPGMSPAGEARPGAKMKD